MAPIIISLGIAIGCLIYAGWLHVYYHNRIRSRFDIEREKLERWLRELDIKEDVIREVLSKATLADLIEANKKNKTKR